MLKHGFAPELDISIAGVRAAIVRAGRAPAETPGSAQLLDDDELDLDKLVHTAGAGSPPAAPSHGRAYRACREHGYGPIDHY